MPAWFDDLGARPLVYVTLGTVMNGNIPLFRLIADALADEPFDVVIALGAGIPREALGEVAGNIRVGGFLPQARILERASVVVSHGGYGTVSASLGAGLPLFLLPMAADQPYNTERCISAGAALGVMQDQPPGPPPAGPPPFTAPDPSVIRDGTRRLLDEPAFRDAARGIAAEIAALPPADHAAKRLEEAVLERQSAPAPRIRRAGQRVGRSPVDPARMNQAATWARLSRPSLFITLSTWFSAVRTDRWSRVATSLLVRPSATRAATSSSRSVSGLRPPLTAARAARRAFPERLHPELCWRLGQPLRASRSRAHDRAPGHGAAGPSPSRTGSRRPPRERRSPGCAAWPGRSRSRPDPSRP